MDYRGDYKQWWYPSLGPHYKPNKLARSTGTCPETFCHQVSGVVPVHVMANDCYQTIPSYCSLEVSYSKHCSTWYFISATSYELNYKTLPNDLSRDYYAISNNKLYCACLNGG